MNKIEVSVVIVCMNNLKNLYPCIDSIVAQNTKVSYEIFVVAYLFSKENLNILKLAHPLVHVIESNEVRGFAENNNLALKKVQSPFTFVLNDDTVMKMPVIDLLYESLLKESKASFMSPKLLNLDGSVQSCGRPPVSLWSYFKTAILLRKEQEIDSKYTYQKGIFKSFNIVGAAFMVKTEVFEALGFFDEKYFFCPEDIALSTLANKEGYQCFVNEKVEIYHLEGGTSSMVETATFPVIQKGIILFLGNNFLNKILITLIVLVRLMVILIRSFFAKNSRHKQIMMKKAKNGIEAVFLNKSTKDLFIRYYSQINIKN